MKEREEARELLARVTLQEYLSTRPPSGVVTISNTCSLANALQRLAAGNIISAPVLNEENGSYLGFIDVMDILSAIIEGNQWSHGLSAAANCANLATFLQNTSVDAIPRSNDAQLIYRAYSSMSLLDIVLNGFVAPTYKLWCHRLAVFDSIEDDMLLEEEEEEADEAAGTAQNALKIVSIFSQSDVAKFLLAHSSEMPNLMSTTLEELGLGRKAVFSVSREMPAADAFRAMLASGATSAAVMDNGKLVANLSPADLRGLSLENLTALALPVVDFLAYSRQEAQSPTLSGSLAATYGVHPRGFSENFNGIAVGNGNEALSALPPPAACGLSATLAQALDVIVKRGVHRIYLMDENNGQLAGVASLTDVINAVIPNF